MMYLIFLAFYYKREGGSLRNFVLTFLGHDIEEDRTPSANPCAEEEEKKRHKFAMKPAEYLSDKGVTGQLLDSTPEDFSEAKISSSLFPRSSIKGGGTFSDSYEQLPRDEETGADHARSLLMERNPADILADRKFPSLVINSSGPEGTAREHSSSSKATGDEFDEVKADEKHDWFLSLKDRRTLKRRTVLARVTPLTMLASFVSDLDVITDWCFYDLELARQGELIRDIALFFAVVGSVMWALTATEFGLMSRLTKLWSGNPLSELEHVGLGRQLLFNVFMEDLPQFILTGVTKPTSVTGVLNITTSGLSLVSKIVRGCSMKGEPSLATQFDMIEQDPAFTQNMFRLRDDAKKKAERAERLVNLAWTNRCGEGEAKAAAVFKILQIDDTFAHSELLYLKADLFDTTRLNIIANQLTGHIPKHIGSMYHLRAINLSHNNLSGPIPSELGNIDGLAELNLSHNKLSGEIPAELGDLSALNILDLHHNKLTGSIPEELGYLINLQTLSVGSNMLTGHVPLSLGALSSLLSLVVADNKLSGATETEVELKKHLPMCHIDFVEQTPE